MYVYKGGGIASEKKKYQKLWRACVGFKTDIVHVFSIEKMNTISWSDSATATESGWGWWLYFKTK